MIKYNFREFVPSLNDKELAVKVYNDLLSKNPKENVIECDMSGLEAMTTLCAKLIFGKLYMKLGADIFGKNIIFHNVSESLRLVIKMGIKKAIVEG